MSLSYAEAIGFLDSLYDHERTATRKSPPPFHLNAIRKLLSRLGDPHREYRVVHIAGTKGKGSTAAMLTSILRAAGMRVGTYTSPHLFCVRERIALDGKPISEERFARAVGAVMPFVGPRPKEFATYFEVLTAAALNFFADVGVDVAVVEAGLGGRYDATSVVAPDVAVLTRIGLDHTERLGESIGEIAFDKAHIIKRGCVAVLGAQEEEAVAPLLERVVCEGVRAMRWGCEFEAIVEGATLSETRISLRVGGDELSATLPLVGGFQAENAACAAAAAKALGVEKDAIEAGLASVELRGRMEVVSLRPVIIVDGAHNPPAARAVARELLRLGLAPAAFVVAINRPKDFRSMLKAWAPVAKAFFFTQMESPRAYPPSMLAAEAKRLCDAFVAVVEDIGDAVDAALGFVGPQGAVVVAGSIYLAGQTLARLGSRSET